MSMKINILEDFVSEFKDNFFEKEIVYENGLLGDIRKVQTQLLDEKFAHHLFN